MGLHRYMYILTKCCGIHLFHHQMFLAYNIVFCCYIYLLYLHHFTVHNFVNLTLALNDLESEGHILRKRSKEAVETLKFICKCLLGVFFVFFFHRPLLRP